MAETNARKRPIGFNETSTVETDDFLLIDGATSGTRKIKPDKVGKTSTSEMTNDAGFQNATEVAAAISANIDANLETQGKAADAKAVGDALDGKVDKSSGQGLSDNNYTTAEKTKLAGVATGATRVLIDTGLSDAGKAADAGAVGTALAGKVGDVKVAGSSVVSDGEAVIPYAGENTPGVVRVDDSYGNRIDENGILKTYAASESVIKAGSNSYRPIASNHIHEAAFYGLAKAAGDTTQAASSNAVGNYTDDAKEAIQDMLGVSSEIAGLKSDLSVLTNVPAVLMSTGKNTIDSSGTIIGTSANFNVYYAPVTAGIRYTINHVDTETMICAFYTNIPAQGSVSYNNSRISQSDNSVTAPINGYVAFRSGTGFTGQNVQYTTARDLTARQLLSELEVELDSKTDKSEIDIITKAMTLIDSYNVYDSTKAQAGYILADGTVYNGSPSYNYIYIDVSEGDVIQPVYWTGSSIETYNFRYLCCYNASGSVVSNSYSTGNFTVPSGVAKLALTIASNLINVMVLKNYPYTADKYIPYFDDYYRGNKLFLPMPVQSVVYGADNPNGADSSLGTGEGITLETNAVKVGTIMFHAEIETLGTIFVGRGKTSTTSGYYIGVDGTNMYYMQNGAIKATLAHNLTIADYITIIIKLHNGTAVIDIYTNGGHYTRTLTSWLGSYGAIFAESTGGTYVNAKLNFFSDGYRKRIWVFGDSYLTMSTTRWPYYIDQLGYYDNALWDGYAGENAQNSIADVKVALDHGTPVFIVWATGMNNADSGAINADWKTAVDTLLNLCKDKGITPIFCTIPNTPNIDHSYKNAWIKASGYRYVDFASAVGADTYPSNWFAGMLASDNVHPVDQGAIALAMEFLSDFPEIAD